jgi:hypothetical protein
MIQIKILITLCSRTVEPCAGSETKESRAKGNLVAALSHQNEFIGGDAQLGCVAVHDGRLESREGQILGFTAVVKE